MTLVFTAVTSKNDVTLCKLDVNVKNRTAVAGGVDLFKFEWNSLKEKCYFLASSTLKIKCTKWKNYARKSIYHGNMVCIEKAVTRDHCSALLGKPRDAGQWLSWQIFLSTPYTHEWYLYSCIPDKAISVYYLDRQFFSHQCYLTQNRIKITCIWCIGCIWNHVSTSSSDVGFYSRWRPKKTSLYVNSTGT